MGSLSWVETLDDGVVIHVYARPRASRTQIAGLHDGRVKIQLASPPVDGQANDALIEFLSSTLGCAKQDVSIRSGARGKRKSISVRGCTLDTVRNSALGQLLVND